MELLSHEVAVKLAKQNLLGIFGERDPTKRLSRMQETYDPDIIFHDPTGTVRGHEAVDTVISSLLDGKDDWTFRPVGKLWVAHDMVTLEWAFGPEGHAATVHGNDIMLVNKEGRIREMYTMIQGASDSELSK